MSIDSLDRALIVAWHEGWHPAALDHVVPWWREKETWFPLYVVLILWLIWKYRKTGFALVLGAIASVGLADFASAQVLKPIFGRLRPCKTPGVWEHLDMLTGCGPGLSMPSSHATNHFAIAVFLGLTCFAERPTAKWLFLIWAVTISLGQVYVGRHYPSDILVGAGLGSLLGLLVSKLYFFIARRLDLAPIKATV